LGWQSNADKETHPSQDTLPAADNSMNYRKDPYSLHFSTQLGRGAVILCLARYEVSRKGVVPHTCEARVGDRRLWAGFGPCSSAVLGQSSSTGESSWYNERDAMRAG
jgi:hypothetical protein